MPSSLINFLQTVGINCLRADLIAIGLPTGQTLYVTDGQFDITIPFSTPGWAGNEDPSIGYQTTTFSSSLYGRWTRGAITSEASFALNSNTMTLTLISKSGESYPGLPMGILNAALNGLFDAAQVDVWTAYMPQGGYGNVSCGIEKKFTGTITKLNELGRISAVFDCADPLYLLGPSTKIPTRVIQSTCPWSFGDSNCDVAGGANFYTRFFTADAGSTQWVILPTWTGANHSLNVDVPGYFQQGVVTCLTGNNAGLSQSVKISAAGAITVMTPWLMPVQAGDTFEVIAGCDKSTTACITRFNNLIHFGGEPYVPVPTTAI